MSRTRRVRVFAVPYCPEMFHQQAADHVAQRFATGMSVPSRTMAPMSGESERETRIRRIDPRLRAADWTPQDFRSIGESKLAKAAAIREYPTVQSAPPTTPSVMQVRFAGLLRLRSSRSARRKC